MKTTLIKQALDSAATTTASQPLDLALNSIASASEPLQKTLEQLALSGEQLSQPSGLLYGVLIGLVVGYAAKGYQAYQNYFRRRQ